MGDISDGYLHQRQVDIHMEGFEQVYFSTKPVQKCYDCGPLHFPLIVD